MQIIDKNNTCRGIRKTAVAVARFCNKITGVKVNGLPIDTYFKQKLFIDRVILPFNIIKTTSNGEINSGIYVKVHGSGLFSQSEAVQVAISRLLSTIVNDEARVALKKYTRFDTRQVERKKFGLHGARRGKQRNIR